VFHSPGVRAGAFLVWQPCGEASKSYPELPSVVSKSLISKYQGNRKCKGTAGSPIVDMVATWSTDLRSTPIMPVGWKRPAVGVLLESRDLVIHRLDAEGPLRPLRVGADFGILRSDLPQV